MEKIYELINDYLLIKKEEADIFDVLHFVQSKIGFIPKNIQKYIASKMCIDFLEINEIVEISSFFLEKREPVSVVVCSGPGCTLKGSREILAEISKKLEINVNEEGRDIFLTVRNCFKACTYGVNVEINGELLHNVTLSTLDRVINKIKFY